MHEASIALGILDIVTERCRTEGFAAVESVRVRIGRAAGIMPEALRFAFDAAKAETIAGEAELQIDLVPLGGVCGECSADFEVEEQYVLNCPRCGSASFTIQRGHEMEISEMEVH